jgi:hypothetical protein
MSKEFTMEVAPGFDFIIEEGQNTSINLRKVGWNGREPKLDIRKWSYQDGQERAMKGIALSDDAANELTNVLVEQGYGDTKRILKGLRTRENYKLALDTIDDPDAEGEDDGSEDYYDPAELLGGY